MDRKLLHIGGIVVLVIGAMADAFGDLRAGLLLVIDAQRRASPPLALVAGIVFGVSALLRPVMLAFVPLAAIWLAASGLIRSMDR